MRTKIISTLLFLLVLSFPMIAQFGQPQLITKTFFYPKTTIADWDKDGDLDMVVSSSVYPYLVLMENNGTGEYHHSQIIADGIITKQVEVDTADINGDNALDFFVTSPGLNAFTWFKNNGQGKFSLQTDTFTVGYSVVKLKDTDADGDLDAFYISGRTVYCCLNDGTGKFPIEKQVGMTSNSWKLLDDIFIDDIDKDQDVDVVTYSNDSYEIYLFTNNGSEVFYSSTLAGGLVGYFITLADVDNDGYKDIVSYDQSVNTNWRKNNHNGIFAAKVDMPNSGTSNLSFIDYDQDGDEDLFLFENYFLRYHKNDGSGNFTQIDTLCQSNYYLEKLHSVDVNLDGFKDLIGTTDEDILFFENDKNGKCKSPVPLSSFHNWAFNDIADIDLDGDKDIIVYYGDKEVGVYRNDGNGVFANHEVLMSADNYIDYLKVLDIDSDGDHDILVTASVSPFKWYKNDGTGLFNQQSVIFNYLNPGDGESGYFDADGDHDIDIFVRHSTSPDPLIAYNVSNDFTTSTLTITNSLTSIDQYVFDDVDNDSDNDILAMSIGTGALDDLILFTRNGQGKYDRHVIIHDMVETNNLFAFTDVDKDGKKDLLLRQDLQFATSKIVWYKNIGSGSALSFAQPQLIDSSLKTIEVVTFYDVDEDNDPDIFIGTYNKVGLYWMENDGTGNFSTPVLIDNKLDAIGHILVSDMDGDQHADIVVNTNFGYNNSCRMQWYKNNNFNTTVTEIKNKGLQLYPNPFSTNFNIYVEEKGVLEVYNILGEKVYNKLIMPGISTIDLPQLDNGTYLLNMVQQNQVLSAKIVKVQ